jgi:hypothetical protein
MRGADSAYRRSLNRGFLALLVNFSRMVVLQTRRRLMRTVGLLVLE